MRRLGCGLLIAVFVSVASAKAGPQEVPKRRRLVERVTPSTSEALIDQALAAGQIDYDTAITHKVFAAFADCRLLPQFRGDDEAVFESGVFEEIRRNSSRLSAATQATLAPFFLPPSAPGSWLELGTSCEEAPSGKSRPAAVEWTIVTTGNDKVKVWAQKRFGAFDEARARELRDELDQSIWPKLTQLMGREPSSDGNLMPNGGDGKVDIYLVRIGDLGQFQPNVCQESSGHLLIDTWSKEKGNRTLVSMRSTLAHELMHAIQWTYKAELCNEYRWLDEAGATWAEEFVYLRTTRSGPTLPPSSTTRTNRWKTPETRTSTERTCCRSICSTGSMTQRFFGGYGKPRDLTVS